MFSEGFSPGKLENNKDKIAVLRSMEKEQIPQLRKQLADVRKLINGSSGERKRKAQGIEAEVTKLLDGHKHRMLEMGIAGRLPIVGLRVARVPVQSKDTKSNLSPATVPADALRREDISEASAAERHRSHFPLK